MKPTQQTPLPLRDYQIRIIQQTNDILKEQDSLLITAPTGAGKTIMLAELAARILERGGSAALLVHRQELIKQSEQAILRQTGQHPGIVWKQNRDWSKPFTIIAQDTIAGEELPPHKAYDTFIVDEAHHAVAPSWLNTISRLQFHKLIGFSATPFRQDREPLSPTPFEQIIRPITPRFLIEQGYLCPARILSPVLQDRSGMPQPINQAENPEQIYRQAIRYAIAGNRRRILLYVTQTATKPPRQVMQNTNRLLRKDGIQTDTINQSIPDRQREAALTHFKAASGPTVLINYLSLTEGTDLPYVDCIIIGRSTASESTIIQMIGRGLRNFPGKKDCLVIDYTQRSDMDDIIHYWRLDTPQYPGAHTPKERSPKAPPEELRRLATGFPQKISRLGQLKIDYCWFQPYPGKPLIALPLSPGENRADRFITVEPTPDYRYRVTRITLNRSGISPITKNQSLAASENEAINLVRAAMGQQAPRLERRAAWRQKPATPKQRDQWLTLHPDEPMVPPNLTAGEASESIAQARFRRRLPKSIL